MTAGRFGRPPVRTESFFRYSFSTPAFRLSLAFAFVSAAAIAQQPRIDGISPSQGPLAGGTVVSVRGAHFTGASVRIDRTPITPLSQSDSEIRITMPPRADNGYAVIFVRSTTTASAEFLYVPQRLTDIAPGAITTIAGTGNYLRDFGRANEATGQPGGIAFDASGNLFIAQPGPGTILRVAPDGEIERFAGSGDLSSPPATASLRSMRPSRSRPRWRSIRPATSTSPITTTDCAVSILRQASLQ